MTTTHFWEALTDGYFGFKLTPTHPCFDIYTSWMIENNNGNQVLFWNDVNISAIGFGFELTPTNPFTGVYTLWFEMEEERERQEIQDKLKKTCGCCKISRDQCKCTIRELQMCLMRKRLGSS